MSTITEATDNGAPKVTSVYVIGHDGSGVAKIGKADDVPERLASIQRMSPVKLRVLTRFDGSFKLETALHKRFKHLRQHGEWFDFGNLDPAAEVTTAVAEIEAEWAAIAAEPPSRARDGEGPGVFLIRGQLWVMPAEKDGGWQCVGQNTGRRRCKSHVRIHEAWSGPSWSEWVIPGIGNVTGKTVDSNEYDQLRSSEAERQDQAMRQLCDRHFANADLAVVAEPAWVRFDPVEHDSLISRFEVGDYFGIPPGYEEMQAKVDAYARRILSSKVRRNARGAQS